jgi:hypothetical protein
MRRFLNQWADWIDDFDEFTSFFATIPDFGAKLEGSVF